MIRGVTNVKNNLDEWIETLDVTRGEICAGIESQAVLALGDASGRNKIGQASIGIRETLSERPPAFTGLHFQRDAYSLSGAAE